MLAGKRKKNNWEISPFKLLLVSCLPSCPNVFKPVVQIQELLVSAAKVKPQPHPMCET